MSAGDSGGGGGKPKPSSSGLQLSTGFTSSAPSIGTTVTMGETTAGYGNGQGYGTLQDNYISHEEQALVMGLTIGVPAVGTGAIAVVPVVAWSPAVATLIAKGAV